jgi:hypothetical protein
VTRAAAVPWALVGVLALAVTARLAVAWPQLGRAPDDPDNYLPLARALAEGRGFALRGRPTAYRPPLYPIALAPMVAALGDGPRLTVALVGSHALLGAATALLTWRAARRWGLGEARALVAAGIVALDPVLVVQARSVMTETLAALLLAGALAALAGPGRRSALVGGLWLGAAALCRPSTLAASGLAVLAALIRPPGVARERLVRAALLTAGITAPLLPWALRNTWVLGAPVWTTTHGGYTLYLANNPEYYEAVLDGRGGAVWGGPSQRRWIDRVNAIAGGLPEPAADRRLRDEALHFISGHPRDFLRATGVRLGRFWAIAPAGAVYPAALRWATAAWTVPLWLAVGAGLARRGLWGWPQAVAPALVLGLTLVHAVFWTDLRMRAPIVPALALIAAGAGARWGHRPR